MIEVVAIKGFRVRRDGTEVLTLVSNRDLTEYFLSKRVKKAELRFDDGRTITTEQRKKAYATMADIASWTGELPEIMKEWLKYLHIARTGSDYFSLSNCSMDTAREFINTILDYALEQGIELTDCGINRTDDINNYLYSCIKNRRCAVCGTDGEIHHVDTIGMGNDRRKVDDSRYRKICLCRKHHTEIHTIGITKFTEKYHVYGIEVME